MSADFSADSGTGLARRFALRLALGVTVSFAWAEALDWDVTFLAPMLAAQLLVKMPSPPTGRQALAILVIVAATSGGMAILCDALVSTPMVMVLVLALLLFLSFYLHARGAPEFLTLLVQFSAVSVPIFSVISPAAGAAIAGQFAKSAFVAIIVVYAGFALFPAAPVDRKRSGAAPAAAPMPQAAAAWTAMRNVLTLLPVLLWYLLDTRQVAVIMLITIVLMLRQLDEGSIGRLALGLLVANLFGGLVGVLAYYVVAITDQYALFTLVLLAISLWFAGEIARGGERSILLGTAFGTFILLLGIGLSPLPGGSGPVFSSRVVYILFASAWTLGVLSLLPSPRRAT